MKIFLKSIALGIMLLPFSACFRKKEGFANLQEWLDKHYSNRYEVLTTGPDDAIRNLTFKVKKSLVAEKDNPLVQAHLKWDKREANFGLTTAMVDTAFAQANAILQDAQGLSRLLKSHGFDKMAVGIKNWTVVVLLFGETTPEIRQKLLIQLDKAFQAWEKSGSYDKEILLMAAAEQANMPGELLSLSYLIEANSQYQKLATYRLELASNEAANQEEPAEDWQYNTQNDAFSKTLDSAKSELEAWAKNHYKKPYFLMDIIEYEAISQQPLRYRFKFSFTKEDHQEKASNAIYFEPDGYFLVDFDLEKNTALSIKTTNDQ